MDGDEAAGPGLACAMSPPPQPVAPRHSAVSVAAANRAGRRGVGGTLLSSRTRRCYPSARPESGASGPSPRGRRQIPGPVRRRTRSESVTEISVNAPEASARR